MQAETATAQLKKEFQFTLSKLSHEIRNPIALINSELQLMASSHPELCSYQQWDSLMDNLEYIRELLNELSDFSHAGTISPVPVNPKEFLSTVLSCEKNTLEYLGITLETHLEDISFPIFLDRVKMRQALLNLIRNASESIEHPKGKNHCLSPEMRERNLYLHSGQWMRNDKRTGTDCIFSFCHI